MPLVFDNDRRKIGPRRQAELLARYDRIQITGKARALEIHVWGIPAKDWAKVAPSGIKSDATWAANGTYLIVKMPNPTTVPDEDWFAHEVGHAIWYGLFGGEAQDDWTAFSTKHPLPSSYARRSAVESWAECFQATLGGGGHAGLGKPDPAVAAKVREMVARVS